MSNNLHHYFMTETLKLAQRGRLSVSPNPMVGCLIVRDGQVVGSGFHQRAGNAHAEVLALKMAGEKAQDATMYVNLEPCCHYGKTPPCTDAIIAAGIKVVYVACEDPNPLVAGKGIAALRQAGLLVEVGLSQQEAQQLNEIFFHYMRYQTPFIIAKWAMSLDGKTVTHEKDDRMISNADSRQHTHALRQQVDAIMVGANTLMRDNPLLTARAEGGDVKQPVRIILTSQGGLPLHLNVFDKHLSGRTLVVTTSAVDKDWLRQVEEMGVECCVVAAKNNQVDLHALLQELGKRGVTSVLVEGGMALHQQFFAEQLVNRVDVYLAPCVIGLSEKKQFIQSVRQEIFSGDYYFSGTVPLADARGSDWPLSS